MMNSIIVPTRSLRKLIGAIALVAIAVLAATAQSSPLVVTGTIGDVTINGASKLVNGRPVYINGLRQREETYFEVKVRLTYHNRGSEPIIVPKPTAFSLASPTISFLNIPSKEAPVAKTIERYTPQYDSDARSQLRRDAQRERMIRTFSEAEPPSEYFTIIEPGGFSELSAFLTVKSGYVVELRKGRNARERDYEIAVPEFPYFTLRFAYAAIDKDEDTEPLRDAQKRWRRFGKLLLTSSGGLYLETDVVINQLTS